MHTSHLLISSIGIFVFIAIISIIANSLTDYAIGWKYKLALTIGSILQAALYSTLLYYLVNWIPVINFGFNATGDRLLSNLIYQAAIIAYLTFGIRYSIYPPKHSRGKNVLWPENKHN